MRFLLAFIFIGMVFGITVEYQLEPGWQLLGVPSDSMGGSIEDYFPIIPPIYTYNTETGGYDEVSDFPTGLTTGFWVLCDRETTVAIDIPERSMLDTFDLEITEGWNLICAPGFVTQIVIDDVIPPTIQASIYDNSARTYDAIDDFPLSSEGFWLLSNIDTTVRFGAYPHDIVLPDTGIEFSTDITATIYDNYWGGPPLAILSGLSEGYYYFPHSIEGSMDVYCWTEADGYYTEFNHGRLVHLDLDPVPATPNMITGVVIALQPFFPDYYYERAKVWLRSGDTIIDSTRADSLGRYAFFDIPEDEYRISVFFNSWIYGDTSSCPVDDTIILLDEFVTSADTCVYFDLIFDDPYVAWAPNIYLYPETTSTVDVVLNTDDITILESTPPYGDGWSVSVDPDGWIEDGEYGFLYYDFLTSEHWQTDSAWVLDGAMLSEEIGDMLSLYGLTGREIADFLDFWLPRIPDGDYISFYPQPLSLMPDLYIEPAPEHVHRLLFTIRSTDRRPPTPSPATPAPFVRSGFTVIEWGGILVE